MTCLRAIQRWPFIHRIAHRVTPKDSAGACWVCAYVWRTLDAQPGFADGIQQGREDIRHGRIRLWSEVRELRNLPYPSDSDITGDYGDPIR